MKVEIARKKQEKENERREGKRISGYQEQRQAQRME